MDTTQKEAPKKRQHHPWETAFLANLRLTGNVSEACRAAGIKSRENAYLLWRHCPEFRREWDQAKKEAIEILEEEARRRVIPLTVKKHSDTLLIFLLKAGKPKKYRERTQHEHT